ncbi:general stress protein [Georgenia sp. M64]|uniref:general stress protein n=1 Tax=Georgenia sp. M64 TaxID=3120520 RepID=UPI0030E500F4
MPSTRKQTDPRLPTLPTGVEVASYTTYLEAQQAVDRLSDEAFDVRAVTIVGTDLRMVERITGRLTYARVAGAGAMSGAWFGLMIALVYWVFTPEGTFPVVAGVLIGVAFGILFAVVSYAFTGGKRDFTSASQVVAGRYSILCAAESAGQARQLLRSVAASPGWRAPSAPGQGGASGQGGAPGERDAPGRGRADAGRPAPDSHDNPYAAPGTPWRSGGPAPERPTAPAPERTVAPAEGAGTTAGTGAGPTGRTERPRYGLRLEDLEGADGTEKETGPDREAGGERRE